MGSQAESAFTEWTPGDKLRHSRLLGFPDDKQPLEVGEKVEPYGKTPGRQNGDHPLEYAEFEGVIPEARYGAGMLMVWDRGNYQSKQEDH